MLRSPILRAAGITSARTGLASTRSLAVAASPLRKFSVSHEAPQDASPTQPQQTRQAHAHAISNPTLANIEKRWEAMPPSEQAEMWMALRDRMKVDWHELTMQEKKAGESSGHLSWLSKSISQILMHMPCSVLDCLWPSRPSSRDTSR